MMVHYNYHNTLESYSDETGEKPSLDYIFIYI